jgi:hypothetical protein
MRYFWTFLIIFTSGCSSLPNRFEVKTEAIPEIIDKNITIEVTGEKLEVVSKFRSALNDNLSAFGITSKEDSEGEIVNVNIEVKHTEVSRTAWTSGQMYAYYYVDQLSLYITMHSPNTGEIYLSNDFAKSAWVGYDGVFRVKESLDSLINNTAKIVAASYVNLAKNKYTVLTGKWFNPYTTGYLSITEGEEGYFGYLYEKNNLEPDLEIERKHYKIEKRINENDVAHKPDEIRVGVNFVGRKEVPVSFRIYGCVLVVTPIGSSAPIGLSTWFAEACN